MKIIKFKNNKNVTEFCISILLLFISIDLTRANYRECGVVNCQGDSLESYCCGDAERECCYFKNDDLVLEINVDDSEKLLVTDEGSSSTYISSTTTPTTTSTTTTTQGNIIQPSNEPDPLLLVYILVPLGGVLVILFLMFVILRFRNPSIPKFKDPEEIELKYSKKKRLEEFQKFSVEF